MAPIFFSTRLKILVDSRPFNFFIIGCIAVTSIAIGMDTYPVIKERWGHFLETLDRIILGIFVIEQVLRLLAEGKKPWRYFKDPWNLFDFFVITICLLPLGQSSVAIVRLVRILRVLRLFKTVPRLRVIVNGMIKSLGAVGYVAILLCACFYIFAVLGVSFFSTIDPQQFGSLQTAFLTLFTTLTMENWPTIMAPAQAVHPVGGPAYFILFIVVGTMVILNLFVGVIVGSMTDATREAQKEAKPDSAGTERSDLLAQIEALENELGSLKQQLKRNAANGNIQNPGP